MSNILDSLSEEDLKRLRLAVENQIMHHERFVDFEGEIRDEVKALKKLLERLQ